jgi:hypothetical protein
MGLLLAIGAIGIFSAVQETLANLRTLEGLRQGVPESPWLRGR